MDRVRSEQGGSGLEIVKTIDVELNRRSKGERSGPEFNQIGLRRLGIELSVMNTIGSSSHVRYNHYDGDRAKRILESAGASWRA